MQGEIAYILKGFPRLSETFISNEIRLLEDMGLHLRLFSIKQGDTDKIHQTVEEIRAPLTVLPAMTSLSNTALLPWLKENLPNYHRAHLKLLRRRPLAYTATLATALWWSLRYRKSPWGGPRKVFIKEFLQAGVIALKVVETDAIRLLHSHFCHGATTVALFASRLSGKPFSFTAHAKDIYQTELNPGNLLQIKIRQARFVTTCTGANLKHLKALAGHQNVHLVYHGLDTRQFHPPLSPSKKKDIVKILAVGRFVEKKGFHYLVKACQQLKRQGFEFHCRILGERSESYEKIQALIAQWQLHDIVTLEGPMPHEALAGIYREVDIFALPCQVLGNGDRDGIPNVLMEAMASGLAVVSSEISGIPELIEDGQDGLLVPEKDIEALTEALKTLIADTGKRYRLGRNARNKICRRFDARHTNQHLKALFCQCLTEEKTVPFSPSPSA
ncbi:MAG: hypothetical protein AXA67_05925 [Methylothermaceae bacteria B42]|nr:MAG: hypothetical protein AXA67_05925 [Methylothermaceae bacteria B42]HHJ40394.1 colanic acid biosynthesis glycosyltransferase WcaL [Methylothermaceae bacterium]